MVVLGMDWDMLAVDEFAADAAVPLDLLARAAEATTSSDKEPDRAVDEAEVKRMLLEKSAASSVSLSSGLFSMTSSSMECFFF